MTQYIRSCSSTLSILLGGAILFFLIAMAQQAQADDVTFEWDANTESDLAGYRIYENIVSGSHVLGVESPDFVDSIPAGTETITISVDGEARYFVLTAYDTADRESSASNEVSHNAPPAVPGNFRKINVTANNIIVHGNLHIASAIIGNVQEDQMATTPEGVDSNKYSMRVEDDQVPTLGSSWRYEWNPDRPVTFSSSSEANDEITIPWEYNSPFGGGLYRDEALWGDYLIPIGR